MDVTGVTVFEIEPDTGSPLAEWRPMRSVRTVSEEAEERQTCGIFLRYASVLVFATPHMVHFSV
ncbi:hypothetical protein ACNFXH_24485 (plasmid) [Escherichia coli]